MLEDITEIEPGIFLGGIEAARSDPRSVSIPIHPHPSYNPHTYIRDRGVTRIVTAYSSICHWRLPAGVHHYMLRIDDSPEERKHIIQHFMDISLFIHNAHMDKNKVLVHCAAGISRSATLLAAYYIKYRNMTNHEAIAFLQSRRAIVNPNPGFRAALQRWSDLYHRDR